MIRSIISVLLLVTMVNHNLEAQDVSGLTIPNTPAFSILNFEPSAIMRPSNVKELAADVLNSFDENGKLLLNLGLEVTPYWLRSHSKLSRQKYLNPTPGQAFVQSLSLSGASVKDSASGNSKLGAGFRFKVLNGKPVPELKIKDEELTAEASIQNIINTARSFAMDGEIKSKQEAIDFIIQNLLQQGVFPEVVDSIKLRATLLAKKFRDSTSAEISLFLTRLGESQEAQYRELAAEVSELIYQRKGFILEFAGAAGFDNGSRNNLDKIGFWANASYYISADDLFTITARYMNKENDTAVSNFDIGLGFLKKTSQFNISVEGMFRWYRARIPDLNINNQPLIKLEKDFTYRVAVQSSYRLAENITVNLSLGKDFNSPFISSSGFFSILGINYSIFNKDIGKLPRTK